MDMSECEVEGSFRQSSRGAPDAQVGGESRDQSVQHGKWRERGIPPSCQATVTAVSSTVHDSPQQHLGSGQDGVRREADIPERLVHV